MCFALENERESLLMRRWRRRMRKRTEGEGVGGNGGSPSPSPDAAASRRRRERDRRQMGCTPPGRAVVDDAAGRDGFGEGPCGTVWMGPLATFGRKRIEEEGRSRRIRSMPTWTTSPSTTTMSVRRGG